MKRILLKMFLGLLLVCSPLQLVAKEQVYKTPEAFIQQSFVQVPSAKTLWFNRELKQQITQLIGHPYKGLRVRYWQQDEKTVWILEEIGLEKPITMGFVVEDNKLVDTEILIFRESRGWEVRFPAFVAQYANAMLTEQNTLSNQVDGITGATLSVDAVNRMARLALFLTHQVSESA